MSMTFRAIVRREGANRAAQAAKQEVKKPKKAKKEAPVGKVGEVETGELQGEESAAVQAEGQEEVAE